MPFHLNCPWPHVPGRVYWPEKVPDKDEARAKETGLMRLCRRGYPALFEITGKGVRERLLKLVWEGELRFSVGPHCSFQKYTSLDTF